MENGATAWEVRELARLVDRGNIFEVSGYLTNSGRLIDQRDTYREAILIEALELLAEKKEALRRGMSG